MNALQKSHFFGGQATLSSAARGSAVRAHAGRLVVQAGRIVRRDSFSLQTTTTATAIVVV